MPTYTKRKLRILFTCLMFLGICTGSALAGDKVEVTYWGPLGGGDGDFMKALVAEYNDSHPGTEVKFLIHNFNEYYIKLRSATVGGKGPDLAVVHLSQLASVMKNDLLVPLDEVGREVGIDWGRFGKNVIEAATVDGKHMSVPIDIHPYVMFVNNALLREAGLLTPDGSVKIEPGRDGFRNFLKTFSENTAEGNIPFSTTVEGLPFFCVWWGFYSQTDDGRLFTDDGKKAAFNNPQSLEVVKYMGDLINEGLWPKGLKSGNEVFKAGKAAVYIDGVWCTGDFEKAGLDFSVVPVPNIFGKERTWGDSHTLALIKQKNHDPAREKAAADFAYWLAQNGDKWAKAGHIPAMPEMLKTDLFKSLPFRSAFLEIAESAAFLPVNDKFLPVKDTMIMGFGQFVANPVAPEKILDRMEKDANRILSR